MRYLGLITISAAILSFGFTLGAAPQPAEAGKACNRLNLNSPCIRSSDVRSTLKLGRSGNDGDLIVRDASKATGVKLDGDSGDVTNSFDGSGVVKAWARINGDGSVASCYRCDPAETQRISANFYEVDFTPLATDIRSRPRMAVSDLHDMPVLTVFLPILMDQDGTIAGSSDSSSVFVLMSSDMLGFTVAVY